jgi:hypothetical protein
MRPAAGRSQLAGEGFETKSELNFLFERGNVVKDRANKSDLNSPAAGIGGPQSVARNRPARGSKRILAVAHPQKNPFLRRSQSGQTTDP